MFFISLNDISLVGCVNSSCLKILSGQIQSKLLHSSVVKVLGVFSYFP